MTRGSLVVAGTGIESMGQMTDAARVAIRRAQRVFYLTTDPLTAESIRALNRSAVSLHSLYEVGRHRLQTYAAMTETVLAEVRRGLRVCFVLYGHPGVFAMPAHAAVKIARQEGYRAAMLPGISADACLIADLGVDPGQSGWQSYEATDFLLRSRKPDPTAGLVLWQIGVVGRVDYATGPLAREKLGLLTEALLRTYPAEHLATLYEAASLPGFPPVMEPVQLGVLHLSKAISPITTLYVPPAAVAPVDRKMQARLGLGSDGRVNCLRPGKGPARA
jgi:uncharacterized protein YabN with tetrapyrrole methylase and pyrophosphatase domain